MARVKKYNFWAILYKCFLLSFLILQISEINAQVFSNNLEDSLVSEPWIGLTTVDTSYAFSGKHASKVDSIFAFGLGIESEFPAEIKGKNTNVVFSGRIASATINDDLIFVFSIIDEQQTYFWKGVNLSPLLVKTGEWFLFSDSANVPANLTQSAVFKTFLWNKDQKNTAWIDDLTFTFKKVDNPTFIPDVQPDEVIQDLNEKQIFTNFSSRFEISESDNSLVLFGKDKPLINRFLFYEKKVRKTDTIEAILDYKVADVRRKAAGNEFVLKAKNKESEAVLTIFCPQNNISVKCEVKIRSGKDEEIIRQAILIESAQPAKEVYRANRRSDITNFQNEYWLDKEGVKFGIDSNSLVIYHCPQISSLQLQTEKNQLWINLDYEKDHPFLHFPLQEDTTDYKLDRSTSSYRKKTKNSYQFSLFAGYIPSHIPRIMKNPDGYLATYIWTEHADYTNIKTNRAVFFGSEKIVVADSSNGGFVRYGIPVTKSIFYNNIDQISNKVVSGGIFPGFECSYAEDIDFRNFLSELQSSKIEICLHTPEQYTTTPVILEQALSGTSTIFGSVSWIDHGYNNHLKNNREDLVCDGVLSDSPFFALNQWEKFGVKYFWNSYYEDYFTFQDWGYFASIEKPYSGWGDFFPNPDFWQHPSRTSLLWHWPTKSVLFLENEAAWEYEFSENKLNNFISDWATEINHCYPAWVSPSKGFWIFDPDSMIIASPGFNRTLEKMRKLNDLGKLNVTTIRDFLDYRIALLKVSYEILPDGRIKLTNDGINNINGLTLATKAKFVTVNNQMPYQKAEGNELVFWFDLKAGESAFIRVID